MADCGLASMTGRDAATVGDRMATMGVVFQIDDYSIGAVQTAHGPHSATRDLPLLRIAVLKERNKKLSGLRCRFK